MSEYFHYLKKTELFGSLPDSEVRRVEPACKEKRYDAGDVVFEEGSIGFHLYVILEGSVEIWKDYYSEKQDRLAVCEAGKAFGELSLIDDFPRSATVVAAEPCRLLIISRDDFREVLRRSGTLSLTLMRALSKMVRERTDEYVSSLREKKQKLETAYGRLKREIGQRWQAQRQLHHQTYYDALTGLPNRALFLNRLQMILEKARRMGRFNYAVLYLDIDRFSVINESLGHLAGDELLGKIAERLRSSLRKMETVARFSGDEFAILIDEVEHPSHAVRVANRVRESLSAPFSLLGKEIFVTAGIGILLGSPKYATSVDILRNVDIAMYGAKSKGPGEYRIFDQNVHENTIDLLALETELRAAIERKEFSLRYQPIVSLENCNLAGFETLVRWAHPERGLISPEIFIPIAEKSGLIVPLGEWIFKEACRWMKARMDQHSEIDSIFINVNISGKQFDHPDFMDRFKEIFKKSGLSPHLLKVEMTESILMENLEPLTDVLHQLKAIGVRLALDDFGTGYSSLSYLNRFPIDVIKIDRSFVAQMSRENQKDLVPVIISIARNLGMEVVAEGVETVAQMEQLQDYGCEYGQGFLFSKPLRAHEAEHLLNEKNGDFCLWPGSRKSVPEPGQDMPASHI